MRLRGGTWTNSARCGCGRGEWSRRGTVCTNGVSWELWYFRKRKKNIVISIKVYISLGKIFLLYGENWALGKHWSQLFPCKVYKGIITPERNHFSSVGKIFIKENMLQQPSESQVIWCKSHNWISHLEFIRYKIKKITWTIVVMWSGWRGAACATWWSVASFLHSGIGQSLWGHRNSFWKGVAGVDLHLKIIH